MTNLDRRLRKLERRMSTPAFDCDFEKLKRTALSELSAPDRELMEEALATGEVRRFMDRYPDVWTRWEEAFNEAQIRTKFPVKLLTVDLMV